MSRPVILLPDAEEDVFLGKAWYDKQRIGLGDEFVLCVEESIDRISKSPEMPAIIFKDIRRIAVRRFPYGVFYRVEDQQISIIAVYHSRRDPRGWQRRI